MTLQERLNKYIETHCLTGVEAAPSKKQPVSYAEYNERARSQGLSYGQLQVLERLGLR